MEKLTRAVAGLQQMFPEIKRPDVAIAGGVSANSGLRQSLEQARDQYGWNIFIPPIQYSTDNAAMIAITGYLKFLKNDFADQRQAPYARGSYMHAAE